MSMSTTLSAAGVVAHELLHLQSYIDHADADGILEILRQNNIHAGRVIYDQLTAAGYFKEASTLPEMTDDDLEVMVLEMQVRTRTILKEGDLATVLIDICRKHRYQKANS